MYARFSINSLCRSASLRLCFLALALASLAGAPCLWGQEQGQNQGQNPNNDQTQASPDADTAKPKQDAPACRPVGRTGDIGPYAIPKKTREAPPPPPPPTPRSTEGMPDYSIRVNAPLVNVDVMVTTKSGQFVPGLKQENFRIFEDGAQQTISSFAVSKAPITAVLLVEYGATNYSFMIQALEASYAFANSLQKDDWVAVEYYDMQPHILVDFTQDKHAIYGALKSIAHSRIFRDQRI